MYAKLNNCGLTTTFYLNIKINLYSGHEMCAQFIFFGSVWNIFAVANTAKSYAGSSFNLGTEMRVSSSEVYLHVLWWI